MKTQQLLSLLRKAITDYNMIKDGDKIAVGLSGGKDSVTLLKLLAEYRRFSPQHFTLYAVTVDLGFKDSPVNYEPLIKMCKDYDVEYFIEKTQIGEVVFDIRKESNPCALCAKMRKGAMYSLMKEKGINKVALGHHSDDLIDTFILSLFYEGRLSTFAPKSYLDKTGITMIRPMIYIKEMDIKSYAKTLPIVKSKCPANKRTKREFVKDIISDISKDIPNIRDVMFTAITHPERYNLFDKFQSQKDEI